jgi:hypothetical protein
MDKQSIKDRIAALDAEFYQAENCAEVQAAVDALAVVKNRVTARTRRQQAMERATLQEACAAASGHVYRNERTTRADNGGMSFTFGHDYCEICRHKRAAPGAQLAANLAKG